MFFFFGFYLHISLASKPNLFFDNVSGDLYIEGKVIPRPQYRFTEQRQTRNRSRPRYDRRRETVQVERREPTSQNWNQNQPPASMGNQAPES